MAEAKLELLGGFRLSVAGTVQPLPGRKTQLLLARLALAPAHGIGRDTLCAFLWEHSGEAQARASLRQALTQARRTLGAACEALDTQGDRIALDTARVSVDVLDLARAAAGDTVPDAASLLQGTLLEGHAPREAALEDWLLAERRRIDGLEIALMRRLAQIALAENALGEALAHVTRALERDPLAEALHRLAMQILAAQGDPAAAIRQFRVCRERLSAELGVRPEPETVALYDRIRARRSEPTAQAEALPFGGASEQGLAETGVTLSRPAATGELRQVAILAGRMPVTDDPEAAAESAAALRSAAEATLSRFGGMVITGTDADLMVVYGLSGARENEHGRALLAARTLLQAMPGLRLGCATGRVLFEPGPPLRVTGAPRRRAVDLAAMARPDTIAEDDAAGTARDSAARPELPLVGRRVEMRQLEAAAAAACEDGTATMVLLRGEPGIGKTRLAAALARRFSASGSHALITGLRPFGMVPPLDRQIALALAAAGAATELQPDASCRAMAAHLLERSAPPGGDALLAAMSSARRLDCAAITLHDWFAALDRPVLLLVEDTHWADERDIALIARLADALAELPVMLLATERVSEGSLAPALQTRPPRVPVVSIELTALPEHDARELGTTFGIADLAVVDAAVGRAKGNPLFLLRLLEAGPGFSDMPPSIVSLVQEQLDRQPDSIRRQLRQAAILGHAFRPAAFTAAFGPVDLATAIAGGFLSRVGEEISFVHALVHEAIYASIPRAERLSLHARVAASAGERDPERWAEHALLACSPDAPRACIAASDALLPRHCHEAGARFIERGLAVVEDREESALLKICRGSLRRERGDLAGALDDYEAGESMAVSPATLVEALVRKAWVLRLKGRLDEADAALERAQAKGQDGVPPDRLAELESQLGAQAFARGRSAECLEHNRRALAFATSPLRLSRAHGGLGDGYFAQGRMRSAHRHFTECIRIAREAGLGVVELAHLSLAVNALYYVEPGAATLALADEAVERAAEAGAARSEMVALIVRADIRLNALMLDEAAADLERADALIRQLGADAFASFHRFLSAIVADLQGRHDEARAGIAAALAALDAGEISYCAAATLAQAAKHAPDAATRTALLARGEEALAAGTQGDAPFWFHQYAAEALLSVGDVDSALTHAARLEAHAGEEQLIWVELAAERIRVLAAAGAAEPVDPIRVARLVERLRAALQETSLHALEMHFPAQFAPGS